MRDSVIALTTSVEWRHWWYRERRFIIAREARRLGHPGKAMEIGASGGGNCHVLMRAGWDVLATDVAEASVRVAKERGIPAMRADARDLPMPDGSFDLVIAYDVLEHIAEDHLAAAEMFRVLRPGGTALIAVPSDMALWSAHDVASGHFRRYTIHSLTSLIRRAGLRVESIRSWNVLLRPLVAAHRRSSEGCDVGDVHPFVNAALGLVIRAERYLPVAGMPGVSLMMRARRTPA